MKKLFLLGAMMCALGMMTACKSGSDITDTLEIKTVEIDNELLDSSMMNIDPIEYGPWFPGGNDSLLSFIQRTLQYPNIDTGGRVIVQFVVERDGSVSNAEVIRGICPLLDKEALRIVNLMPKWKPAYLMHEDCIVRVQYMLPIWFDSKNNTAFVNW